MAEADVSTNNPGTFENLRYSPGVRWSDAENRIIVAGVVLAGGARRVVRQYFPEGGRSIAAIFDFLDGEGGIPNFVRVDGDDFSLSGRSLDGVYERLDIGLTLGSFRIWLSRNGSGLIRRFGVAVSGQGPILRLNDDDEGGLLNSVLEGEQMVSARDSKGRYASLGLLLRDPASLQIFLSGVIEDPPDSLRVSHALNLKVSEAPIVVLGRLLGDLVTNPTIEQVEPDGVWLDRGKFMLACGISQV